ncbi:AAA family ATPase [Nocardiopsis sp. NPDC007018]|uniref:ATP-binding protein n=1 Tax=Nocardiopsis sp. NPDC007018 TaxID=3155721 RepID=UPI0033D7A662
MSPSALVGRRHQVDHLLSDAARARSEGARTVLLCGDAGIGKSRLLEEYLERTPLRHRALGACLELGAEGIAFAPFTALLRQLVREGGPLPAAGSELGRLLPGQVADPAGRAGSGDHDRARLFEAVLTFLEERAEPDGLSLVVEDLHWADASTRDLLVFLLRNLGSAPVHLVVSVRSDDLHRAHPLRRALPELERLPRVTRLDLAPLDREAVAAQAAALSGSVPDSDALELLLERSGGNPLFVESFLAAPDGGVPDGPRELLMRRVEPLTAITRKVLGLASVAGDRVDHALLAEVAEASGVGEDDLDEALREAVDARVLGATDTGYVFRHALLAEAVKGDLLPGQRVRAHRRYATALEAGVPGPAGTEAVVQLAHHAYSAHDHPRALTAAWEAARYARVASAHPERLALLERVLELWELLPDPSGLIGRTHGELLLTVCGAAQVAGDHRRAVEHAGEALADLDPAAEPELVARLLVTRGLSYKELGRIEALDDLRAAAALVPDDHPERAVVSATTAAVLMLRGSDAGAERFARAAIDQARASGDRASEADALVTLGSLLHHTGSEEALELLREGVRIARERGYVQVEMRGLNNLGSNHSSRFEYEEWRASSEEALARSAELGLARSQGSWLVNGLVSALMNLGRLDEARERLHASAVGRDLAGARRQSVVAQLAALEGDWETSRRALEEFARLLPRETATWVEYMPPYYTRVLLLLFGPGEHWVEAARTVLEGEREIGMLSRVRFSAGGLSMMAMAVWRLRRRAGEGDREVAEELAAALRSALERDDWPTSPEGALNRHASLGFLEEDSERALEHWERALPLAERALGLNRGHCLFGAFWAAHDGGDSARAPVTCCAGRRPGWPSSTCTPSASWWRRCAPPSVRGPQRSRPRV